MQTPRRFRLVVISNILAILVLILFTSFTFFFNLAATSIDQSSDEVIYARVTQTLFGAWERGESGFPLKHGSLPFYEKPPLKFLLSATALKVFGNSTFGLRVSDGVLGCLSVLLTVVLISRVTASFPIGLATGFLVILVPEWVLFAHSFRRNVLDGLLTTLILFASFWSWRGYRELSQGYSPRFYFGVFSALCGLATLVKSVAGLVPLFPVLLLILMHPNSYREKIKIVLPLAVGPLIFLGYCALLYVTLPKALATFLGTEILQRATTGFDGHNVGEPLFYFRYLFSRAAFIPLGLLIPGILGTLILFLRQDGDDRGRHKVLSSSTRVAGRYLIMMGWCPIFIFSISSAKLPWYISPYAPFLIGGTLFGVHSLCRVLISAPLLSRKKSLQRGFITFTLFIFCLPIIPRTERVFNFVVNSSHRIPIDRVVEKIVKEQGNAVIVDNVISSRATPIKGRFNVEGIYKEMIQHRIKQASSAMPIVCSPGDFVIVSSEKAHSLPEGGKEFARMPPLPPRREEVIVVRY